MIWRYVSIYEEGAGENGPDWLLMTFQHETTSVGRGGILYVKRFLIGFMVVGGPDLQIPLASYASALRAPSS